MGGANVPAFLTKIWTLVDDPSTDELIAWDASGTSFHVYDQARFAKEILPRYFKHNNIASFIRQLNMYGFRKVGHVDEGTMKSESDDVEFKNPYFILGQEHLLEYIKRKPSGVPMSVKGDAGGFKLSQDDVQKVLGDVNDMQSKQDHFSSKMDSMKKENEALWRELASLRQKHIKQQQIVNKLIQFMIHLVRGKRGLAQAAGLKRKMPLMINDSSQVGKKQMRSSYNNQLTIEEMPSKYVVNSPPSLHDTSSAAGSGPIIHDVTDMFSRPATSSVPSFSENYSQSSTSTAELKKSTTPVLSNNLLANDPCSEVLTIPSLDSTDLTSLVDSNLLSPDDTLPPNIENISQLERFMKDHPIGRTPTIALPSSVTGQLENMQDDIDGLHDLLSGGHYNFDASTLTSLFSGEPGGSVPMSMPLSLDTMLNPSDENNKEGTSAPVTDPGTITGNELVSFQYMAPESLLGLTSPVPDLQDLITSEDIAHLLPEDNTDNIDPLSFLNSLSSSKGSGDMTSYSLLSDDLD